MRVDSLGNIFVEVDGKEYEADIIDFHPPPPEAGFVTGRIEDSVEPLNAEIEWTLLDGEGKEAKDALSKLTDEYIEQIDQDLIAHYMEQHNVR